MKKILKIAVFVLAAVSMSSCYESYLHDYEYPNMGFAMPKQVRTVVSTTNKIYVGVSIGGKRQVDMNDWAQFMLDESLLAGTGKTMLPENYYQLGDPSAMRVRKSNLAVADVEITFTDDFYADPVSLSGNYALPFRLIATSIPDVPDTLGNVSKYGAIREGGETSIVAIKYICGFSGTYYRVGSVTEVDATGAPLAEPVTYNNAELMNNPTVKLTTKGRFTVTRPGVGASAAGGIDLTITPVEGASTYDVTVAAAAGTTLQAGASASYILAGDYTLYNGDTKAPQINLEYTYTDAAKYYKVSEKLVLRQYAERELTVETF